ALDAGGQRLVDKINALVEDLAPYSDEKDQLATALFGSSEVLTIDQDGRTTLPERLREYAGITTHITFVGLGEKFQMWEPKRFEAHLAGARQKVRDLRKLPAARRAGGAPPRHIPVMLSEVVAALDPKDADVVVDGTFGAGGYSEAILSS